jgi:uracil-DNA glycosylase family protein
MKSRCYLLFVTRQSETSATDFLPKRHTLEGLRAAAQGCEGCDLYEKATQTVFGEGPPDASVILLGEQPGDMEDRQGHPFVGPAGRLLDRALAEAKIPREEVYITNAVKHFRWIQRGKRRLHQKPAVRQITACKPWLEAELEVIQPKVLVCLGATAAQSVLGRVVSIRRERSKFFAGEPGPVVFVTVHPSSIFRRREEVERQEEYCQFLADLRKVRRKLAAA